MTCKVGMVSLGCPKNQMDAELMLAKLEQAGFELVAESGLADVVIGGMKSVKTWPLASAKALPKKWEPWNG